MSQASERTRQESLSAIWEDQSAPQAPVQDLTRLCPIQPPEPAGPAPEPQDLAGMLAEILGWPQWVRLYAKPSLAMVALSRLARSLGLPGGVRWVAPGTGKPLETPRREPGVTVLRGDWAPDAQSMLQAQEEASQQGLLVMVDESTSGFRLARGGAMEAFGLSPQVALYGPALAGGLDLAALVGIGQAPPQPEQPPHPDSLAAAAALLPALSRPELAGRLEELGGDLVRGLEYFMACSGQPGMVKVEGPGSMPRLASKRLWAFFELAKEEGLAMGPLLLINDSLEGQGLEWAWQRLARAAARLRVLPEGEKAPLGWKGAYENTACQRVEQILATISSQED